MIGIGFDACARRAAVVGTGTEPRDLVMMICCCLLKDRTVVDVVWSVLVKVIDNVIVGC